MNSVPTVTARPIERPRYANGRLYHGPDKWIEDNRDELRRYYDLMREWLDVDDAEDSFGEFCLVQHDLEFLQHERRSEQAEERYTAERERDDWGYRNWESRRPL